MKSKNVTSYINQEEIYSYLKDIRKIKVMTKEREEEIGRLITENQLSKSELNKLHTELIEGNLRFVIKIAKEYQNQGMTFPDLVCEGNIGLIKAVENFDWNKNVRFVSYAVWWIRQSIIQSLNDSSRTIRLPVNVVQRMVKKDNITNEIFTTAIGLDDSISDDGMTLMDIICNDNADNPEDVFNSQEILREKINELLDILDERERNIVEDYYGLSGCSRTLEDIGDDFGLTKERVRQIKERAIKKIRNECFDIFEYL